jgi:hypothetical protein
MSFSRLKKIGAIALSALWVALLVELPISISLHEVGWLLGAIWVAQILIVGTKLYGYWFPRVTVDDTVDYDGTLPMFEDGMVPAASNFVPYTDEWIDARLHELASGDSNDEEENDTLRAIVEALQTERKACPAA